MQNDDEIRRGQSRGQAWEKSRRGWPGVSDSRNEVSALRRTRRVNWWSVMKRTAVNSTWGAPLTWQIAAATTLNHVPALAEMPSHRASNFARRTAPLTRLTGTSACRIAYPI